MKCYTVHLSVKRYSVVAFLIADDDAKTMGNVLIMGIARKTKPHQLTVSAAVMKPSLPQPLSNLYTRIMMIVPRKVLKVITALKKYRQRILYDILQLEPLRVFIKIMIMMMVTTLLSTTTIIIIITIIIAMIS